MALDYISNATFTGRIVSDPANYPQGKAQNETSGGANDGTPYEEQRANDTFGHHQSLLRAAGITPSGVSDTAAISEYVQAIVEIAMGRAGLFVAAGTANAITLAVSANQQKPRSYFDGMRIRFRPTLDNTAAATVNVESLGVKNISNSSTGFLKTGILTEIEYVASSGDFQIVNTERYVDGDDGFEIINGVIRQWGHTGNLGDTSGQPTISRPFLVPFPSSVDEALVSTIGLVGAVSPASVLSTWHKGSTTLSDIFLTYREVTGDGQNNWAIAWVATGR